MFWKYRASFQSAYFMNGENGVSCRSFDEDYQRETVAGHVLVKVKLHLYRNHKEATERTLKFMSRLEEAVRLKNLGKEIEPDEWSEVQNYLLKSEDGVWSIDYEAADKRISSCGCFAIRTNCIEDPIECLKVYRARNVGESAFLNMESNNGGNRLFSTEEANLGEILINLLAQSIRMIQLNRANKAREEEGIAIPSNSMEQVTDILEKVRLVRAPGRASWNLDVLSKKACDCLELLGIEKPVPKILKLV